MVTARIVKAEQHHIDIIAGNARDADVRELWCASYQTPREVMEMGIDLGTHALTGMVDDVPVVMWGVITQSILFNVGVPWMVGSKDMETHAVTFLRRCRKPLLEMMRDYDILVNYVDERNVMTIRWLEWMGFHIADKAEPYGVMGLPFRRFSMGDG